MSDLTFALSEVEQWLALKLSSGKCSRILRRQLAEHYAGRTYNVFQIWDEIAVLEGNDARRSMTKPAEPFRRPPLIGFWHKHFFQARFLARNLQNEWTVKNPQFKDAVERFSKEAHTGKFVHEITMGLYKRRVGSSMATGEWIVYAPIGGQNLYLTLGKHREEKAVFENIMQCLPEFPQLESLLA